MRCCFSAGVSVQSELSTVFGVAVERENWRGLFSLVGSSAVQRTNEQIVEHHYIRYREENRSGYMNVGGEGRGEEGKSSALLSKSDDEGGTSIHSSR
jgi:hypothetical protein